MARQKTELEKRYEKELKRIKVAIKREEKKGYIIPAKTIPQKPKKITEASIRRLQNITPQKIRQKSKAPSKAPQEIPKIVKPKTEKKSTKDEAKREAPINEMPPIEQVKKRSKEPKITKQKTKETLTSDEKKEPEQGVKKPKAKSEEEKEKIVEEFYDKSAQEKGEEKPPKETDEIISNLEDVLENKFTQVPPKSPERLARTPIEENYSQDQLDYEIENIESKLENYEPLDWWSQNPKKGRSLGLINIKENDVNQAKAILEAAIESLGRDEVAKNIANNSREIDEILREIMYRGSGNDFIAGRNAVIADLSRLGEILLGGKMDIGTSIRVSEIMEQDEYEDVLE